MQLKQLVKSLDKSHDRWLNLMEKDSEVDVDKLHSNYGSNYTSMLKLRQVAESASDYVDDHARGSNLNFKSLDALDRKRLKEGRL